MRYRATVLEAGKPNKNNRVYSRELLERVVGEHQERVRNRSLLGQIGYAPDSIVWFTEVSHLVTELVMEGDLMVAEIEVLNTPCGEILKGMMQSGVEIALRPAGVGFSRESDGVEVIDDSYRMVSINVLEAKDAA